MGKTPSEKHTVMEGKTPKKKRKTPYPLPAKGLDRGTQEYFVDKLLAFKTTPPNVETPKVYFLVQWEGYKVEESTWEAVKDLESSMGAVNKMLKEKGKKLMQNEQAGTSWLVNLGDELPSEDGAANAE